MEQELKILNPKSYEVNFEKVQTIDDIKNILQVLHPVLTVTKFPDYANQDLWVEIKNG